MQTFPPSSIDSYKALARTWAATVTIVTARRAPEHVVAEAPELDGFTATAFLTISMSPPIIAVSATAGGSAFPLLRDAAAFAVNLLAPDQVELASAFALPAAERGKHFDRRVAGHHHAVVEIAQRVVDLPSGKGGIDVVKTFAQRIDQSRPHTTAQQ